MTKFVPNPAGLKAMERSKEMAAAMRARAEATVAVAREMAPVDSGDYKEGLEAESAIIDGKAAARIVGKDFKSGWIEFGTSDTPAFAVIRRACDATGLKVEDRGRSNG